MYHQRPSMHYAQPLQVDYFTMLDDYFIPPTSAYLAQKIDMSFSLLIQLKDHAAVMGNRRAYNSLMFLSSLDVEYYLPQLEHYSKIPVILANICFYCQQRVKQYLQSKGAGEDYEFDMFATVLSLIYAMSDRCRSFSDTFLLHRGVNSLVNYLNDDSLLKKLVDFKRKEKQDTRKSGIDLVSLILGTLVNIRTLSESSKVEYNVINVQSAVQRVLKLVKAYETPRVLAVMVLVAVLSDDEISKLPLLKTVAEDIAKIVKIAAKAVSENYNLTRRRACVETEDETELIDEVCFVSCGNWNWNIAKLLSTMSGLAINDSMKFDIYETFNMKESLEKIVFYGNETEKLYAMKLLWQLCFNGSIARKVLKVENLFQPIANIAKQVNLKNSSLKKYCEGILWSLQSTGGNQVKENSSHKNHIMISYNSKSRDICTRIKSQLESNGYTVWIDFERIAGSSLDSMAAAVEDCSCLLMCMTEKYKESPNCRAEAEYAFRVNKPIIPLVLEKDYTPDGWLGIIVGSKIYVNFIKNPFDEAMRQLLQQISLVSDTRRQSITTKSANAKEHHAPSMIKAMSFDAEPRGQRKEPSPSKLQLSNIPNIQLNGFVQQDGNPERLLACTNDQPLSLPVFLNPGTSSKNPSPRLQTKSHHTGIIDQLATKISNLSSSALGKPAHSLPASKTEQTSDFSKLLNMDLKF